MVVSDFNIICFGQKKITINSNDFYCVETYNLPIKSTPIYKEYFFAQKLNGIWYSFYPRARENGDYLSEWFDLDVETKGRNVIVLKQCQENVLNIIRECSNYSASGYIGILFRLEGYNSKNEYIRGAIRQQCFERKLLLGKIKYNQLYVVKTDNSCLKNR